MTLPVRYETQDIIALHCDHATHEQFLFTQITFGTLSIFFTHLPQCSFFSAKLFK